MDCEAEDPSAVSAGGRAVSAAPYVLAASRVEAVRAPASDSTLRVAPSASAVCRDIPGRELTLGSLLGSGVSGHVYAIMYTGTPAVLKTMSARAITREVSMTRFVSSAYTVIVHGYTFDEPGPGLIMELMHASVEDAVIRLGTAARWSLHDKLRICADIAGCLTVAHEAGIAHMDIKPTNIMLCAVPLPPTGTVAKVADFGSAVVVGTDAPLPRGGAPTGETMMYAAPELLNGTVEASTAADVYAFAITAYEILMQRRAYSPDQCASVHTFRAIVGGGCRPSLDAMAVPMLNEIPASIVTLLSQCWHPDPACRPHASHLNREFRHVVLSVPPAPLPLFCAGDDSAYAAATLRKFGGLGQLALASGIPSVHPLALSDVFVAQDVRASPAGGASRMSTYTRTAAVQTHTAHAHTHTVRPYAQSSILTLLGDTTATNIVILGEPGSGKSSALRQHALRWAQCTPAARLSMPLPILVELKEFAAWMHRNASGNLVDFIVSGGSLHYELDRDAFVARMRSHVSCLDLLLDGLDEVIEPSLRSLVARAVENVINSYGNPTLRVILTSRSVGYNATQFDAAAFKQYTIQPLTDVQINNFIGKWYLQNHVASGEEEREVYELRMHRLRKAVRDVPSVRELAGTPLLLTMIAIVNSGIALPTTRVALYEACARLLVGKWKSEEALASADTVHVDLRPFNVEHFFCLLSELAWQMQAADAAIGNSVQRHALLALCTSHAELVLKSAGTPAAAVQLMNQLHERHGVLVSRDDGASYGFVHRTFLEYFCARAIHHRWSDATSASSQEALCAFFGAHATHDAWAEVLTLVSGMMDSARIGPCLSQLLSFDAFLLAARCVESLVDRSLAEPHVTAVRDALLLRLQSLIQGSTDTLYDACKLVCRLWGDDDATCAALLRISFDAGCTATHSTCIPRRWLLQTFGRRLPVHLVAGLTNLGLWASRLMADDGLAVLRSFLPRATHLVTLDLSHNWLGELGARDLVRALPNLEQLASLDLSNNTLCGAGVRELATTVGKLGNLTTLDLGGNSLGEDAADALVCMLCATPRLTSLSLSGNALEVAGTRRLVPALCSLRLLTVLDLRMNKLGAQSSTLAQSFRELMGSTQLTTLDLRGNELTPESKHALVTALPELAHLRLDHGAGTHEPAAAAMAGGSPASASGLVALLHCGSDTLTPPLSLRLHQRLVYAQIMRGAIHPPTFVRYKFISTKAGAIVHVYGVQYEYTRLWSAPGFAGEVDKFVASPTPLSETACYCLNYYRGVTEKRQGPCFFAIDRGTPFYEDGGAWHRYVTGLVLDDSAITDVAPW